MLKVPLQTVSRDEGANLSRSEGQTEAVGVWKRTH